jgi:hypothetical protein
MKPETVLNAVFRIAAFRDQGPEKDAIFASIEPARGQSFCSSNASQRDFERGSFGITPHAPSMLTDRGAIWSGTPIDTENLRTEKRVQSPYTAITGQR